MDSSLKLVFIFTLYAYSLKWRGLDGEKMELKSEATYKDRLIGILNLPPQKFELNAMFKSESG